MEKIGIGWAYVSDVGRKYVNAALDAGRLSQGEMVHRFEKEFARLHDQKYGIALNSGTSALHVGLEAMKEKFGWCDRKLSTQGGGTKTQSSRPGNYLYRVVERVSARRSRAGLR